MTSGTHIDLGRPGRRTHIYVPAGADSSTPMVISLHGATGFSESHEQVTGFTRMARREKVITVYPQAKGVPPATIWMAYPGSEDIRFIAALAKDLHARNCAQPDRTFVNGFSMGAMVTSRLMCAYPKLFAGAAMVSGVLPPRPGCSLAADTPIVVVHGRHDELIEFDGSMPPRFEAFVGPNYTSSRDRVQIAHLWADAKGCTAHSHRHVSGAVVVDFRCPGASTRVLVHSGEHEWEPPTSEVGTSAFIWRFMRQVLR